MNDLTLLSETLSAKATALLRRLVRSGPIRRAWDNDDEETWSAIVELREHHLAIWVRVAGVEQLEASEPGRKYIRAIEDPGYRRDLFLVGL